jgi:polyphosphate glucokinase
MKIKKAGLQILSIDIGGSHIKGTVLNESGELQVDYDKLVTPKCADPLHVINSIKKLVSSFPHYDKVSVGFPGYVKNGVIITAPNLGTDAWHNFNLSGKLAAVLKKPTKVVNDADMQGLGVVDRKGFEMVITLGTGFGTAILMDGNLLPHLELAHHPVYKKITYDEYIGEKALKKQGLLKWNKRVYKIILILKTVFNYDKLYIGGGNASKINFALDGNIKIAANADGIKGGARLWLPEKK